MQQSALSDRGDISQEITDGFRLIFVLQKTVHRYLEKLMLQANSSLSFWYLEVYFMRKSIKLKLKKPRLCLFA